VDDGSGKETRRPLLISKVWVQAGLLVFLFGFFVLGLLAYRTYSEQPPIPDRVVSSDGRELFARADVLRGQEVFLRNGLMEYGSIFGHGAYLGPDYTADYLHRAAMLELGDVTRARLRTQLAIGLGF
jgi:nitric oxide reductase subunit B